MPRYSPEQVRRRQITVGAVAVVLIALVVGCTAAVTGALRGGLGDGREAFQADDAAMRVDDTPDDARALSQLPEGIELAEGEVMGIDVSSHQEEIDWDQVASDGYAFAYIKATEGAGFTDTHFEVNWEGALAVGITPGAYHYFTLCSSGLAQARDFLEVAPPRDDVLPPALDLEFDGACNDRPPAAEAQAQIDEFTAAVEEAWGRRLVIYSSREWREHYGLPVAEGRPDWLFSEGSRPGQEDWTVWQFRFDGDVSGIEGGVDIDVARIEVLRELAEIPPGEGALGHEVED